MLIQEGGDPPSNSSSQGGCFCKERTEETIREGGQVAGQTAAKARHKLEESLAASLVQFLPRFKHEFIGRRFGTRSLLSSIPRLTFRQLGFGCFTFVPLTGVSRDLGAVPAIREGEE